MQSDNLDGNDTVGILIFPFTLGWDSGIIYLYCVAK